MQDHRGPVDVAWISLSLHHLLTPEKHSFMRQMRKVVCDHGIFLIYENASPDGEDRDAWLRRWDDQKPSWPALATEEWDALKVHARVLLDPNTALGRHRLLTALIARVNVWRERL
jgi:hypothetical protein